MNFTPVEKLTGEELFTAFKWFLSALTITDVDRRNAIVAEVRRRLMLTAPPPSPPVEELLALQRRGVEDAFAGYGDNPHKADPLRGPIYAQGQGLGLALAQKALRRHQETIQAAGPPVEELLALLSSGVEDGFNGDIPKLYPSGDRKAATYEQGVKLGHQLYQATLQKQLTKETSANPSALHLTEYELKWLKELAATKEAPRLALSNQSAQVTLGLLDAVLHGVVARYEKDDQARFKPGSTPPDCAYNIGLVLGEYLWRNCSGRCLVGRPDIDNVTADLNTHDRPPLPSPATATSPPAAAHTDESSSPTQAEVQVAVIEFELISGGRTARVVPVSDLHKLLGSGDIDVAICRLREALPYTWFRDHLGADGSPVILLKLPTPPAPGVSVDVEIAEVVNGGDLEDYSFAALQAELSRRYTAASNNCCPYCGVALDSTSHGCKLAGSRDKMIAYCGHHRLLTYQPPKLVQDLDTREKIRAALDAIQPHQAVIIEETATEEGLKPDELTPAQYRQLILNEAQWYNRSGEGGHYRDALMAVADRIPPGR